MRIVTRSASAAALSLALGTAVAGGALAEGLPKTFAWTAYGTKSSGYAVSVAIGNALSEEGYKLRVLPAKNDVSRMTPLKSGRVQFSAMGVGSFQAQEGVLDFGKKAWGPQPVQLIMMSWADTNTALVATAKDANIMKAADMKGKRIAWVVGAPALNQNMTAWLAYGNLGWGDVTKVEVPGWGASIQGIIDGNIDGAIASTNSSMLFQVDSSPRGLRFFPAPAAEKENWARLNKHAPWFAPHTATAGVGLSKEKTLEGASYGYPILIAYESQSEQAVYELVKLMHTKFDKYKDAHNSGVGFAMDRQVFEWILPYHAGAVKYFKEIGVWTAAAEANNQKLLKRQQVLAATWKKSGGDDYAAWMKARAAALKAAGFDPIWEK
ncbi:MAG: TAXI family TRAP transporter solute-binding subunit [Alphaproteobacteria bacterium]|jgi:TRAP transporter TAXI family solute receptor|nr:TAXI family TRAP transporter solute-binding subunit [Alphaproteobacteria bacterium]